MRAALLGAHAKKRKIHCSTNARIINMTYKLQSGIYLLIPSLPLTADFFQRLLGSLAGDVTTVTVDRLTYTGD